MSKHQSEGFSSYPEIQDSVPDPDARAAAAGPGAETELKDTSPTNRVSNKYNHEYYQPLRWGIDSLYLSFAGSLH